MRSEARPPAPSHEGATVFLAGRTLAKLDRVPREIAAAGATAALSLVFIVLGVPLIATAAGWLLAGREPPALARPAME